MFCRQMNVVQMISQNKKCKNVKVMISYRDGMCYVVSGTLNVTGVRPVYRTISETLPTSCVELATKLRRIYMIG